VTGQQASGGPPHASVAQEAAALFAALQSAAGAWAGPSAAGPAAAAQGSGEAHAGAGGPAPGEPRPSSPGGLQPGTVPCRSCPLCQLLAVLRGVRPEAVEHLADATAALAAALREMLGPDRSGSPAPAPGPKPDGAGVDRIDITD
jgi:hypothetical protein